MLRSYRWLRERQTPAEWYISLMRRSFQGEIAIYRPLWDMVWIRKIQDSFDLVKGVTADFLAENGSQEPRPWEVLAHDNSVARGRTYTPMRREKREMVTEYYEPRRGQFQAVLAGYHFKEDIFKFAAKHWSESVFLRPPPQVPSGGEPSQSLVFRMRPVVGLSEQLIFCKSS